MASRGNALPPPVAKIFRKKIGILYEYDFYTLPLKFYWLTFEKIHSSSGLGSCHVTSSQEGVNENLRFSRFLGHILWSFKYFFHEISMVARYYRVLTVDIKTSLTNALFSLETRPKVPLLAIFWRFLAFFMLPV